MEMGPLWSSSSSSDQDEHIGIYDHIHCQQEKDWDCGIACFLMAVRFVKTDDVATLSEARSFLQPFYDRSTPLWTIDIYVALRDSGITDATMYTTSIGIDPKHRENSWYASHLDSDVERIDGKFKRAAAEKWRIEEIQFDLRQFCTHKLPQSGVTLAAIILVCSNTMKGHPRETVKYAGHYLFLINYDYQTDEALYLDPSLASSEAQRVALSTLEAAFVEPGTDCDIIVINKS